jgi:hypothetical protein
MNKIITLVLAGILLLVIFGVTVNAANEKPQPLTNISEATRVAGQGVLHRSMTASVAPIVNIGNKPAPRKDRSKKDRMKRNIPSIVPGTGDFGSYLLNKPDGIKGVYAMQQVHPTLNLPGLYEPTLYAPTIMSPNFAPIESVTAYWNYSGMTSTGRAWGVWDHYTGSWAILRFIDSDFVSKYVGVYPEGQFYLTEIIQDSNNTWNVLLYNFRTYSWEIQYSSNSKSLFEYGWNMFETYFNGTCPSLPGISSMDTRILNNGQWEIATNTYGSLLDYSNCANYKEDLTPFYKWSVSTPVVTTPPVINAINITYPDGGEILKPGRTYNITWSITGNTGPYVKIELLKGSNIDTLITSKTNNIGLYKWKIPYQKVGTTYRVRITSNVNSTYKDTSQKTFTIKN